MQLALLIIAALAPVAVLLWYIYKKDSKQPEPAGWLLKAFGFGVLSVLLTFVISLPISVITGLNSNIEAYSSVFAAFMNAFCLAAIPEELAKFIMLWLLLRKNPYFDEKFDGIVYAVCVGMGFAGVESVLYLLKGLEDGSWVGIGVSRALFAVPGHFLDAVFMGYFYSLYHFGVSRSLKTKAMILVAPILAHGIYDGILFSGRVSEGISFFVAIVFFVFFFKLKKMGSKRIEKLMNQ